MNLKLVNNQYLLMFCICFLGQILELNCQTPFYKKVIVFHDIATYCRSEFGMEISEQFYKQWAKDETGKYVLYFSKIDELQGGQAGFDEEKNALKAKAKYDSLNFQTMMYHTYGSAAVLLSEHLLSYPVESLSFIAFHEATHLHFLSQGMHLPYIMNEAACDVVANYASVEFAKRDERIRSRKAKKHRRYIEKIANLVNQASSDLKPGQTSMFDKRFKMLKKEVGKLDLDCSKDRFLMDRYSYEINNAFLLRNRYYSKYYFKLKELLNLTDLKTFLNTLADLPRNEEESVRALNSQIEAARIH